MRKCPIRGKSSDLPTANSGCETQKYGSLAGLAMLQGCSPRTIREYCKRGLIPEGVRSPGGHWKIKKPLSEETRSLLSRLRGDWWFTNNENDDEFEADIAEDLMLAQLCGMDFAGIHGDAVQSGNRRGRWQGKRSREDSSGNLQAARSRGVAQWPNFAWSSVPILAQGRALSHSRRDWGGDGHESDRILQTA